MCGYFIFRFNFILIKVSMCIVCFVFYVDKFLKIVNMYIC